MASGATRRPKNRTLAVVNMPLTLYLMLVVLAHDISPFAILTSWEQLNPSTSTSGALSVNSRRLALCILPLVTAVLAFAV